MAGLRTDIDIEGIELLADAYANAPERVIAAADRAGKRAADLMGESIADETPVRTGFLLRSEAVRLEDHFSIIFRAGAPYASFVQRRNPFVDRGVANVQGEVDAVYEAEFDQLAEGFFDGV